MAAAGVGASAVTPDRAAIAAVRLSISGSFFAIAASVQYVSVRNIQSVVAFVYLAPVAH